MNKFEFGFGVVAATFLSVSAIAQASNPYNNTRVTQSANNGSDNPTLDRMNAIATGNSVVSQQSFSLLNNQVQVGGLLNLDAYYSTDSYYTMTPSLYGFGHSSNSTIYLNNANFLLGGNVGFAKANLNIAYFDRPILSTTGSGASTKSSFSRQNQMTLDEAYITLANFQRSPFYAKLGKTYGLFGSYHAYAMVPSLTMILSEENGTGAEGGIVLGNGLYAKANVFSESNNNVGDATKNDADNFSAKVGYQNLIGDSMMTLDFSYLNDVRDLAYVNSNDFQSPFAARLPVKIGSGQAWAANLGFGTQAYDIAFQFVWLPEKIAVTLSNPTAKTSTVDNPYAGSIHAGYHFEIANHKSRLGVGYEFTHNGANLLLPAHRYLVNYSTEITHNVTAQLAYYYDSAYKSAPVTPRIGDNNLFIGGISVSF